MTGISTLAGRTLSLHARTDTPVGCAWRYTRPPSCPAPSANPSRPSPRQAPRTSPARTGAGQARHPALRVLTEGTPLSGRRAQDVFEFLPAHRRNHQPHGEVRRSLERESSSHGGIVASIIRWLARDSQGASARRQRAFAMGHPHAILSIRPTVVLGRQPLDDPAASSAGRRNGGERPHGSPA